MHGIGLEAAGVEFCERFGVKVDDLMQTSNPDVYSVGDCSSAWQFTHMAGTQVISAVLCCAQCQHRMYRRKW